MPSTFFFWRRGSFLGAETILIGDQFKLLILFLNLRSYLLKYPLQL